jgi:hypothetical protein
MHQDVASQHLQRRVFGVWFAFSLYVGTAPIASGLALVLLRLCTNHVVVTLVLTVLLTRLALLMAQVTCVQSKNPQEALTIVVRQNLFLLPITSFVLACLMTNSSTGQWLLRGIYKNQEVPASIFPLWWLTSSLRLFFAAFILGLLVVIRFYGPWSISA